MTLPSLNPDQDLAIDFALGRDGCNIFARPGKGKTRIALETIYSTGERTLIIAPLFPALTSWPNENKKWQFDFNMRVLHGKEKKVGNEDVTVINYDGMPWLLEQDLSSYKYVIYDEIHWMKNPGAKRFRRWRKTAQQFEFRLGLTGTPLGNKLRDLWGQMFMVDFGESLGRTMSGPNGFERAYFERDPYQEYLWYPRDGARAEIFSKVKDRAISLDFFDGEMPELLHNVIPITIPPAARAAYTEMQKQKRVKDTDVIAVNAGVQSVKLRQIAAGNVYDDDGNVLKLHKAKQDALKRLVDELQGDPIIVFIQFAHDVTAIKDAVGDVPVIDGGTSADDMIRIVNDWNDKKIPVLVAHPSKAGVGGNMQTGGCNVCFYTLPWSLGDIEQAIGRVWRQGQKSDQCIIHYLTCSQTKDEDVALAAQRKKTDQDDLFKTLTGDEKR